MGETEKRVGRRTTERDNEGERQRVDVFLVIPFSRPRRSLSHCLVVSLPHPARYLSHSLSLSLVAPICRLPR